MARICCIGNSPMVRAFRRIFPRNFGDEHPHVRLAQAKVVSGNPEFEVDGVDYATVEMRASQGFARDGSTAQSGPGQ